MMKYVCDKCGTPTNNDQSFNSCLPPHKRYEVHRCDKCDRQFHQELEWESKGETINESTLICPHCGYKYEDYDAYRFDEGDTEEVECEECGRRFDLVVETRRLFSTKRSLSEMPDDYDWEEDED